MSTFGKLFGKKSKFFLDRSTVSTLPGIISDIFDGCEIDVGKFFLSEEYRLWLNQYLSLEGRHPLARLVEREKRRKRGNLEGYMTLLGEAGLKMVIGTLKKEGFWPHRFNNFD